MFIPLLWMRRKMWLAASKMTPVIPTSWYLYPCGIPFPLLWAEPNDLLLTKRTGQKWWMSFLRLGYKKTDGFLLSFTCSKKAHCPVVARNRGRRLGCEVPNSLQPRECAVCLPPVEPWEKTKCWPTSVRDLELEAPSYVLPVSLTHINGRN